MRRLFVTGLTAISLSLLIPGTGLAQFTHPPNTVGLFLFPDGSGAANSPDIGSPINVHLVLLKPTDEQNGDTPYTTITGFECMLNFNPIGNLYKLGEYFTNPNTEPVGDHQNIQLGYLEYIVGFFPGVPVTNESVVLIRITFLHITPGNIYVTLGPTFNPHIPGEMAFQSVEGDLRAMHPYIDPIYNYTFLFGEPGLAVEDKSFGSVKALYR